MTLGGWSSFLFLSFLSSLFICLFIIFFFPAWKLDGTQKKRSTCKISVLYCISLFKRKKKMGEKRIFCDIMSLLYRCRKVTQGRVTVCCFGMIEKGFLRALSKDLVDPWAVRKWKCWHGWFPSKAKNEIKKKPSVLSRWKIISRAESAAHHSGTVQQPAASCGGGAAPFPTVSAGGAKDLS